MKSLLQLISCNLREWSREPGALFWSFGFPILMTIAFGLAFSGKTELVRDVAIVQSPGGSALFSEKIISEEQDPGKKKKTVEKVFKKEGALDIRYRFHRTTWDLALVHMKRGKVTVIITEKNNTPLFHYDPMNPEAELIQLQMVEFFNTGNISREGENTEYLTATGTRYIDFLVPGLITMGIMFSIMWGVSYSLIEMRSKKLMRRMVATPMSKTNFLLAHVISRLFLTITESFFIIIFSYFMFDITIQGSIWAIVLLFIAGNACFIGLAILISSRTDNTQVGSGMISAITMPMMILSGIFFNYNSFPPWAVKFIKFLPLTKLTDEVRSVINEGTPFVQSMDGVLILTVTGVIFFIAGLKVYKWY